MTNVWLDTNIVLRWNLRLDTAEARKLFSYMEDPHRIILSEVVLCELTEHYVRQATQCLQREKDLRKLRSHLELPIQETGGVSPPNDLRAYYRKLLTDRCGDKSIALIPLSGLDAPLEQLLDMAVKRLPPFEQREGAPGFPDALILFSMLRYTQKQNERTVVLISEDKIFKEENVSTVAAQHGVELLVFESVGGLTTYLDSLLGAAMQEMRRLHAEMVRTFLLGQRDQIEQFIKDNAEFEPAFLAGGAFVGTIRRIRNAVVRDITKVSAISEERGEEGVSLLLITFDVRLDIELEIEGLWAPPEPQRYRVGQEMRQAVHGFGLPETQIMSVERDVRCEATAKQQGDRLSDLQLKEVQTCPFGFRALRPPAFGQGPPPPATP